MTKVHDGVEYAGFGRAIPEKVGLDMLASRILVKIDKFKYTGKLIIPDNAQRLPTVGVVYAIGKAVTQVSIGDKVVFGLYSGTVLKFQNTPYYRVLTEDEIFCKKNEDFEVGELVEEGA